MQARLSVMCESEKLHDGYIKRIGGAAPGIYEIRFMTKRSHRAFAFEEPPNWIMCLIVEHPLTREYSRLSKEADGIRTKHKELARSA